MHILLTMNFKYNSIETINNMHLLIHKNIFKNVAIKMHSDKIEHHHNFMLKYIDPYSQLLSRIGHMTRRDLLDKRMVWLFCKKNILCSLMQEDIVIRNTCNIKINNSGNSKV